jgi:recombination protein RecA
MKDELSNFFNKKYKEYYFKSELPKITREHTGIAAIDYISGGGFIRGRIHELYGGPSTGKTSHSLYIIDNYLKRGLTCVYFDLERTLDSERLEQLVKSNLDNFHYIQPHTGESCVEGILESARIGADFIVVDSVPYLLSHQSEEADVGQTVIGGQARFLSASVPKITHAIGTSNTILLFINQVRTTFNYRGAKLDTPGGSAIKFMYTMRLELSRWGATPEKDGETIHYKVAKNKSSTEAAVAETVLYFDSRGICIYEGLRFVLEQLGIIVRNGAFYKLAPAYAEKLNRPEKLSQGKAACIQLLKDDQELYESLYSCFLELL